MTLQLSTTIRNGLLDLVESTIGTSAVLKLKSGAPPANCEAADSGTVLSLLTLSADYLMFGQLGKLHRLPLSVAH